MKALREWLAAALAPDMARDAAIARARKSVARRLARNANPLAQRGIVMIGDEAVETPAYQRTDPTFV